MFCRAVSFVTGARVAYFVGTRAHFIRIGCFRLLAIRVTAGCGHGGTSQGHVDIISHLKNWFTLYKYSEKAPYERDERETDRREIASNRIRKRTKRVQRTDNRIKHKHKKDGSDQGIRAEAVD